jgi:protein-S-isoprenylcysteine O-methyltransferase Ste14
MVALKSLFFMILGLSTVMGIVPWLLLQVSGGGTLPTFSIWLVGLLPFLAGLGLFFWCNGLFASLGKGTLAPMDAPIFLVKAGPYQWVRNPMYLAVFSVVLGEAMLFHSLWLVGYVLLLGGVTHLFVVKVEEPRLARQFGESYQSYLRTVPRWVPRSLKQPRLNVGEPADERKRIYRYEEPPTKSGAD